MRIGMIQLMMVSIVSVVPLLSASERGGLDEKSSLRAGIGLVLSKSVYKGDDADVMPVPLVYYSKDNFYLAGTRAGYRLFKDDSFNVNVIAQMRFDGYDDGDSSYLRGMDDRYMSLDAGMEVSYNDGWGKTSLSYITDVLSVHDGQEVRVSYSKRFSFSKLSLTPAAGIFYQTNNLTDYYYGVRAKEATAVRAAYKVGEAFNPFVRLQAEYEINSRWSVIGGLTFEFLDDTITGSPIVDEDYKLSLITGVIYSF